MRHQLRKNIADLSRTTRRAGAGFTLIELLIVVAIISALAITVFVALNPQRRIIEARDAKRAVDVSTLLDAIHSYVVDNRGSLPTGLTPGMPEKQIGTGNATACSPISSGGCSVVEGTACIDLAVSIPNYLKSNPIDPEGGTYTSDNTGYTVTVDSSNVVTIKACGTQGTTPISVSR